MHHLYRFRFSVLLVSLLLLALVAPVMEVAEWRRGPVNVLFAVVILSAINAASESRNALLAAVLIAIPAFVLNWSRLFIDSAGFLVFSDLLLAVLLFFTIAVVLRAVFRATDVGFDELSGAVASYLLIAVAWAVSFRLIETMSPGAFAQLGPDPQATFTQFLYFSLTTVTTLGYGVITPISPVAHILATLEAVTGVLYVAVLIARLVSLYRR
jgi:hypothetical protein